MDHIDDCWRAKTYAILLAMLFLCLGYDAEGYAERSWC